jgi:pimeloyl-ACP methyl ester carboxylesterase
LRAGEGPEHVVCLHGLGANKLSFFTTTAALAGEHTVHAIDLPGFGASGKPARAPYDAPFFARMVRRYLDAAGIGSAHVVGNSMGGRIGIELALSAPSRVRSLSLLSPALAFLRRRELAPLVKLLRPELAAIPHPMVTAIVKRQLRGLFADPDRLAPAIEDIGARSFCEAYRSRAARIAFYASARNIYLESPHGEPGFWQRLARLETPALFVWGDSDRLVPAAFSRHVERALPHTRSVILEQCGHVPQIEAPDQVNALIAEHIAANTMGAWQSRRWPRRQAVTAITATRTRFAR